MTELALNPTDDTKYYHCSCNSYYPFKEGNNVCPFCGSVFIWVSLFNDPDISAVATTNG